MYRRHHHAKYIDPDPLVFVRHFDQAADREVVGLIASSLAYGNVKAMMPAIASVLGPLGDSPAAALDQMTNAGLARTFRGWRYRVTPGVQLAGALRAIRDVRREFGSLDSAATHSSRDACGSLELLTTRLQAASPVPLDHLIPSPSRGSACKRLCLLLRWLVRRDAIDPGGWSCLNPAALIMPIDTHVFRAACDRGWTTRRTVNLRAALDITSVLRSIRPKDPLRYDFALTRPGIRWGRPADDRGKLRA